MALLKGELGKKKIRKIEWSVKKKKILLTVNAFLRMIFIV